MNGCHVVNGVGVGGVRGDSMKNRIFGVVVIVLGLNSRDYFAKFFYKEKLCPRRMLAFQCRIC